MVTLPFGKAVSYTHLDVYKRQVAYVNLKRLKFINDSTIIKHWKQDWIYENKVLYNFYKDNEWIKNTITTEQAKGTWTQKVYPVDDSPRYESFGTWVHVDGKHFWEGCLLYTSRCV